MNDDDVDRIERELGLTLPEEYARLLRDDPFDGGLTELYGEVDEIIEHNLFMRNEGYVRPWPMNWLIIGDDNAGDDYILDLNLDLSPIFFLDHELFADREHLDNAVKEIAPNLTAYVDQVKDDVREWLEDDGYRVGDDPAAVLRQVRRGTIEPSPPTTDEALASALERHVGTEPGIRRVGAIGLLPKEIAAASDVWFEVFFGVCRIARLTGDGGVQVWLWRDDRASQVETVVLAAASVEPNAARSVLLGALPFLSEDLLQWENV